MDVQLSRLKHRGRAEKRHGTEVLSEEWTNTRANADILSWLQYAQDA